MSVVCVFGDIWGSIGVYIGGIVRVRNKGRGRTIGERLEDDWRVVRRTV